jgi:hypothetical protein
MSSNYSLYSIPLYWIIALFPHGYGVRLPPDILPTTTIIN